MNPKFNEVLNLLKKGYLKNAKEIWASFVDLKKEKII